MNWSCGLYAIAVLGVLFVLRRGGDRWWLATVLMFSPRWVFVLPLVVLIPAALVVARKALWFLALGLVLDIVPIMGLCLPWRTLVDPKPCPPIRVLTCNVHYNQLDASALSVLINQTEPDIVALQGWLRKHKSTLFAEEKWHLHQDGELCLASRFPIRKVEVASEAIFRDRRGALARYDIECPYLVIHLFNLHLASPRHALQAVVHQPLTAGADMRANSELRRRQSEFVQRWAQEMDECVLLTGDFNTPPDSTIYSEFWAPFRNAYTNAGIGWGFTYYTRFAAVRIDHQLASPDWQCRRCRVGPDVGSPHRPVLADWERIITSD